MEKIFAVKYSFHPEAQAEFYQSVEDYDERDDGLGYDFAVEVLSAIERVAANPEIWPIAHSDIRRCLVHRGARKNLTRNRKGHCPNGFENVAEQRFQIGEFVNEF